MNFRPGVNVSTLPHDHMTWWGLFIKHVRWLSASLSFKLTCSSYCSEATHQIEWARPNITKLSPRQFSKKFQIFFFPHSTNEIWPLAISSRHRSPGGIATKETVGRTWKRPQVSNAERWVLSFPAGLRSFPDGRSCPCTFFVHMCKNRKFLITKCFVRNGKATRWLGNTRVPKSESSVCLIRSCSFKFQLSALVPWSKLWLCAHKEQI